MLASRDALESLSQHDAGLSTSRIVEGLAEAGAAALAVSAPAPPGAAAAADALALPLLELPDGATLHDIERAIIGLVVDRHNALQARASQLYRQLAQVSVENRGFDAIIREAAALAGRIVTFEDTQFRLRSVAVPPGVTSPSVDDAGLSSVDERGRLGEAVRALPASSTTPAALWLPAARWRLARYTAPVVTRDRLRGFISICAEPDALTEFDQLAASRGAAICALELTKDDAVFAAEQRMQGNLVDELLRPYADAEAAGRRAAQAGFSIDGTFAVYALGPAVQEDVLKVSEAIDRWLRQSRRPSVARAGTAEVLVICELRAGASAARAGDLEAADRRLRELGEALFRAAAEIAGAMCAGSSRAHAGLAGLPHAAIEAREALRVGRRVYGEGRLVAYADLGLYRVLHALRDTPELRTFFEQTLGPLVEHDRRTGQNLVETLEAFFACHGNLSQTATRLQLHRNSLLYRIGRIREIGGLDLEDPETRLSLQVALKAQRLLS